MQKANKPHKYEPHWRPGRDSGGFLKMKPAYDAHGCIPCTHCGASELSLKDHPDG